MEFLTKEIKGATKVDETTKEVTKKETPNVCWNCGNSLFPNQFRCEKCGMIQPPWIDPKDFKKEE